MIIFGMDRLIQSNDPTRKNANKRNKAITSHNNQKTPDLANWPHSSALNPPPRTHTQSIMYMLH